MMLTALLLFAYQQVVVGIIVLVTLSVVARLWPVSFERQSWLWLAGSVLLVLIPIGSVTSAYTLAMPGSASIEAPDIPNSSMSPASPDLPSLALEEGPFLVKLITPKNLKRALAGLAFIWGAGASLFLLRLLFSYRRTREIRLNARSMTSPELSALLPNSSIMTSSDISSPMVVGLRNRVILIPVCYSSISMNALKAIVAHEQAHIERQDLWAGAYQRIVEALFWWNPLIYQIHRRLNYSRELACDQRAINRIGDTKSYAQMLLNMATVSATGNRAFSMGLFEKKYDMKSRIEEVVGMKSIHYKSGFSTYLSCLSLVVGTATLSGLVSATEGISHMVSKIEDHERIVHVDVGQSNGSSSSMSSWILPFYSPLESAPRSGNSNNSDVAIESVYALDNEAGLSFKLRVNERDSGARAPQVHAGFEGIAVKRIWATDGQVVITGTADGVSALSRYAASLSGGQ